MDAVKNIERRVEDGFVFDERGRWIYMSELRIYEKRVIDELGKGNVLSGGLWVPIGEAKRRAKSMPRRSIPLKPPTAAEKPKSPPAPTPGDTSLFEAQDNMLETICIDAAAIRQAAPGADMGGMIGKSNVDTDAGAIFDFQARDELHETAVLMVERTGAPENGAGVNADTRASNDTGKKGLAAEVDGALLFGLSKGAAAGQSKYAMEYIEEFRFARKRKNLFNGLAAASISLAAAAAVAFIVIQNMG